MTLSTKIEVFTDFRRFWDCSCQH